MTAQARHTLPVFRAAENAAPPARRIWHEPRQGLAPCGRICMVRTMRPTTSWSARIPTGNIRPGTLPRSRQRPKNIRMRWSGVRAFSGNVPARSRIGNWMSEQFFRLWRGCKMAGHANRPARLRPPPARGPHGHSRRPLRNGSWRPLLPRPIPGAKSGREVPIETVYLNGNTGSHFRPIADLGAFSGPFFLR